MSHISIIVAVAENNAIGRNNDLLTYISADLKRFKALTTGYTIIMGRKTFESLPKGALPNRRNVVISRNSDFICEGAELVQSPEEALSLCESDEKVFIIGGGTIYKSFMKQADSIYLTKIHHDFEDADTFFPDVLDTEWKVTKRVDVDNDEKSEYSYSFIDLVRI